MEKFIKIAIIENEIQAQYIDAILNEREIPHRLRSYHDSAFDGLFQSQKGWGHVEAPEEFKAEILEIVKDTEASES